MVGGQRSTSEGMLCPELIPLLLIQDWGGQIWVLTNRQSCGHAHRSGCSVTTPLALEILEIWLPPFPSAEVFWTCARVQCQLDLGDRPSVQDKKYRTWNQEPEV